jgi:hypothetical protein
MAGLAAAGGMRRIMAQRAHLSSDMVKRILDENQQLLLAVMVSNYPMHALVFFLLQ